MNIEIIPRAEASITTLMKSIDRVIINPIIFFLFALAMVYFLYGVVQYFLASDNEEVRKSSKSHMLFGVIGLFVMVAVFGIMNLILATVGENKIKINNSGDYVVGGGALPSERAPRGKGGEIDIPITKPVTEITKGLGDLSDNNNQDKNLDPAKSPFPDYDPPDSNKCWRTVIHIEGENEYEITHPKKDKTNPKYVSLTEADPRYNNLQEYVRDLFLSATHQDDLLTPPSLPVSYGYESLVKVNDDRVARKITYKYHVWADYRAPIKDGTFADCSLKVSLNQSSDNYKYTDTYKSSDLNLSNPQVSKDLDVNKSPFPEYIPNNLCWRKEIQLKDITEYKVFEKMDSESRKVYLSETNQKDSVANKNYPIKYSAQVALNPKDKLYYLWLDLRAPKGNNPNSVCNLVAKAVLPKPQHQSKKQSALTGSVASDGSYYRVVDSGTGTTLAEARNYAVTNALIQIAMLKNENSISNISFRIIPPEKYFPLDTTTGEYDYFVAVESPK